MQYGKARWLYGRYLKKQFQTESGVNEESHHASFTQQIGADRAEYSPTPRLDLAIEAHEAAQAVLRSETPASGGPSTDRGRRRRGRHSTLLQDRQTNQQMETSPRSIEGVQMETDRSNEDVTVTTVRVETEAGARAIGKEIGTYISIEAPKLRHRDPDLQSNVVQKLQQTLSSLIANVLADPRETAPNQSVQGGSNEASEPQTVLVIGLGNAQVTPDALGPLVAEKLFVTRHLQQMMPGLDQEGYRSLAAVAPGVLGVTGIETQEIVRGIVEHVKPSLVIAVDALASRSLTRVNSTIQIADNGIHPGSGVGNHRKALTMETLGVPVIGIGVPTVVDAATIATEVMEGIVKTLDASLPGNAASRVFNQLDPQEKWKLVSEVLEPLGKNVMVTPKEIDEFVEDAADLIAKGVNLAVHPGMTVEEADILTH